MKNKLKNPLPFIKLKLVFNLLRQLETAKKFFYFIRSQFLIASAFSCSGGLDISLVSRLVTYTSSEAVSGAGLFHLTANSIMVRCDPSLGSSL